MTLPTGVLLAAGDSRRFGSPKLMHPLPGGEPLGVAAARRLIRVVPDSIAVVRPGDADLRSALRTLGFRIVENRDPGSGMGASLALAVKASPDARGWLVALADMPWIRESTIRRVAQRIAAGASLASPRHDGRRGHPVGFSARWASALGRFEGDRGARELLDGHPDELELIDVDDPGVRLDVDLPEDLAHARGGRRDTA